MMPAQRAAGLAAITLGIGFNIPYAVLASLYDYPSILRQPAAVALGRFAAGGPTLVLAWYAFMLAALALAPVAISLALTPRRLALHPALAIGAAITGSLAAVLQAIGLSRWVFVVPMLANDPEREAAARAFAVLNAYGGVAVGEHLGQLLTAIFAAQLAGLQHREGAASLALCGRIAAAGIAIGTGEGLAIALGRDGALFSLATILGFLVLSAWLVATGWLLAAPSPRPAAATA